MKGLANKNYIVPAMLGFVLAVFSIFIFNKHTDQVVTKPRVLAATPTELPRVYIDSTYPTLSGSRTIYNVKTNCTGTTNCSTDVQSAINAAVPGDEIVVQAGATFANWLTLPNKTCNFANQNQCWIVIRTSNLSSLPPAGVRVGPADASNMAKLVSPGNNASAIATTAFAHHYRLVGLEVTKATPTAAVQEMISLGNNDSSQTTLAQTPHDIVLDRMYIHGNTTSDLKRCIGLNSATTAIIDSYVSDCHVIGQDSQAIGNFNGPGPYKIVNNFLSAATENIIFGGTDPLIPNLIASDIEFRYNYLYKPLSWREGDASYAGFHWQVKNLFELKNAQRVLVEGNIMENNWSDAQTGSAVLLNVTNQDGACLWCTVRDITFRNNIIRHSGAGLSFQNNDWRYPSSTGFEERIEISNNLWEDLDGTKWRNLVSGEWASSYLFLITSTGKIGPYDVKIDHNTGFHTGTMINAGGGVDGSGNFYTKPRFVYTNNLAAHNEYGVFGDGTAGFDDPSISSYFPDGVFTKNAVIGQRSPTDTRDWSGLYTNHPGNFFPLSWSGVGFTNQAAGNYKLLTSSPYHNAGTDGKDLGADMDVIAAATANVISGNNPNITPTPTPTPTPPPPPPPPPPPSPITDTVPPVITAFDVLPHTGTGAVSANFNVSDSGGSFLQRVELWRTGVSASCSLSNTSGCFWVQASSVNTPAVNQLTASISDSPGIGGYLYGMHVVDGGNNMTHEAQVISLSIINPGLSGDINQDHIVNSIDFSTLNQFWLTSNFVSDLNQDGIVNTLDYSLLNNNWFKTW